METIHDVPDKSSIYADEGTAAHELGERCLKKGTDPKDYLGEQIKVGENLFEVNAEMVEAVTIYVEYVRNLGPEIMVEQKLDLRKYIPECFGTSDAIVETYENEKSVLYVCDLKYGKGVPVNAYANTQGMIYALGALQRFDIITGGPLHESTDEVVVVIVQPRIQNISEYRILTSELLEWAEEELKPAAKKAMRLFFECRKVGNTDPLNDVDLQPTDKGCKWCKAKETCKARAMVGYQAAVEGFEDLTEVMEQPLKKSELKDPRKLGNKELAILYHDMKLFVKWFEGLKETLLNKMMDGEEVPGLKPVLGHAKRAWAKDKEGEVDIALATRCLRSAGLKKADIEKVSIVSPAEAEKWLKANKKDHEKRLKRLEENAVTKVPGSPTIANDTDKRPSIAPEKEITEEDLLDFLN